MNFSTSILSKGIKTMALVVAVGVSAFMNEASAITFCYDGIIYKSGTGAKATQLTPQKAGTKVTVGEAGPTKEVGYSGDINLPSKITYDGVEYTVITTGTVFQKNNNITSVTIGDGIEIKRGAFMNDSNLVKATLPSDLKEMGSQIFYNCVALEEIVIPGTLTKLDDTQFSGCESLHKITFEAGDTELVCTATAFSNGGTKALDSLIINRQLSATQVSAAPFRNAKKLGTVIIDGTFVDYPSSYFEYCSALKKLEIKNTPKSFGTNVFAGSGLESFDYPASVPTVPASIFQGCKSLKKVTLAEGVTTVSAMAFMNAGLEEITLPSTLTSIGQMAFSGTKLSGKIEFPAALKSIGLQAYANNTGLTEIVMGGALETIGDGAFMGCSGIAKFTIDAANTNLKSDETSTYVTTADGKTLVVFAPASTMSELKADFEAIAPYACYKAANLKVAEFKKCQSWGDYSMSETGISALALQGTIGRYVAKGAAIENLTVEAVEVPFGVAMDCQNLKDVTFAKNVTVVKQDAFNGCSALETLNLGNILAILETDCFKASGLKTIIVGAANPAGMAEGVFAEGSTITVKVPVDFVDTYKAADGWKYNTIEGDANIAAGPSDMGMPAGLYYAGEDGNLHAYYEDGQSDVYDVGGAYHTFQLAQFKNRIYGACAGKKFVYSATGSVDGDGKLFYISQIGGNIFQAVVLDNYGNNAYKDPFGLYIYGEDLFVNDRNVAIRKIPASAIALDAVNYPSWMENNWMGWYNQEWSYGNIKAGWSITKGADSNGNEIPVYWLGIKYNGQGIYRFTDENLGSASQVGTRPADDGGVFINQCAPILTTFFIDEANQHMYIYLETDGGDETTMAKGGVYRVDLATLEANHNPKRFLDLNPVLIDGSPVKWEGSSTNEHVGISQFSADENGEYLYWCYRAPTAAEAVANEAQDFTAQKQGKYWWAEKYDENNPLHHSCIKRIKLGEAKPTVEIVAKDVNGYGCVPVNFAGSKKPPLGVNTVVKDADNALTVAGGMITVAEDAVVSVYALNGVMVNFATLAAGETMSVVDLPAGAYVVAAKLANGTVSVAKFVK